MKLLRRFLLLTGLLLAAGWLLLRASLIDLQGDFSAKGINHPASIRFDAQQRAYVQADSLNDALFAEGWLHATQRLWQLELLRRAGQGRLAQMLGSDLLAVDKDLWRMGVPQLAARLEKNATPAMREQVAHYVAGLNAGIAALPVRPAEFLLTLMPLPQLLPADVYAVAAVVAAESAGNASNEALRLELAKVLGVEQMRAFLPADTPVPGYPYALAGEPAAPASGPPASEVMQHPRLPRFALGSNGWVVSPSKTSAGNTLFAFDSHDELALPNLFYEVHLFFQGRQVRGWSVPGMPGVINGYNEHIAWGFTNTGDTQDLFLETRDPQAPLHFIQDGKSYPARIETVEIPVRGADSEHLQIVHSRHGPLISDEPPLALAWTATLGAARGMDMSALLQLNLASNWAEANRALDALTAPSLNATYADRQGHIGLRTAGLLPQRGHGAGLFPLDGSDSRNDWRGTLAPEQMTRRLDPAEGYLAAANSRVNPPGAGPLVSADNAPPYRIARIQQALGQSAGLDAAAMRTLQKDWHDGQAALLLPALLPALMPTVRKSADTQPAVALLENWLNNPQDDPGQAAPLIFQQWYLSLAELLFAEKLGPALYQRLLKRNYLVNTALDQLILDNPESPWWRGQRQQLINQALHQAVQMLARDNPGEPARWRYGDHHQVLSEHQLAQAVPALGWLLNAGPFEWGGGPATVGRASYRYDRPFIARYGASVRTVIELDQPMRASSVIPGGQSGHPLSRHYADQYPQWLAGEQQPIATTPELAGHSQLILKPVD